MKTKKNNKSTFLLTFYLCSLLTSAGCGIHIGDLYQSKHERTVQCSGPLAPGSTIVAETKVGSIIIAGAEVNECNVTATITAHAPTEEEAQQIAEQVKIELVPAGDRLIVKAHTPTLTHRRSIAISYNITTPKQVNIECTSSFGSIKVSNIAGQVKGETSSGSITGQDIDGSVQLNTSFGAITCVNASGETIRLKSSSGAITAENVKGSTQLETSFGSITCKDITSNDELRLKTSSGSVTLSKARFGICNLRTSFGSVTCDDLQGDSIELHSDSGTINATQISAKTTRMSTSFGRIKGREITASALTAKSNSGSIDIACSVSTPPDLTADVDTSFGSIEFVTPPNFAGQVELATSFGSVKSELPVTITGVLSKKKITGKIREGSGRIHLETSSGSINIK
jgi:DUF4097 and DUF4098 domain-containing protein YvlB